jgi:hypothetical protein
MKIHRSLTAKRILDGARRQMFDLDNVGFCIKCGHEADDCDPDARKAVCGRCGERAVYGAEELVLMVPR